MDATLFMTTLRARVDWLNAKVTAATNAWSEYQRACDAYSRQHPRPWVQGQGTVLQRAWIAVGGGAVLDQYGWVANVDRPYGTRFTDVFGDMRDATRAYQLVVRERNNTLIVSPADAIEASNLITRGNQLGNRAQTLSAAWRQSNASIYDTKVTNDTDAWLRTWVAITPFAAQQASVPGVTATVRDVAGALIRPTTGGSTTGADPLVPQQQPQGLPTWVMPVAGGILVVGVGYALWQYSRTH